MNKTHHVVCGASAGAWLSVITGSPGWQVPIAAGISALAAPLPDIDQRKCWRTLDRWLPDEWLGHGGPLRHRGITHWWGLHLALTVVSTHAGWAAEALCAGLWSHLAADLAVGARSRYRGPGVPLMPWWGHVGLGLRNDSLGDYLIMCLAAFLSVAALAQSAGMQII